MRLVPFTDDYRAFDDPAVQQQRNDLLTQLAEQSRFLAEDISDERINDRWVQRLIRNLERYCLECARTTQPNPGVLMELGSRLRDAWLADECSRLPTDLTTDLERLIDAHTDLARLYMGGALARMEGISNVRLPDVATPDMIVEIIERTSASINDGVLAPLIDAGAEDKAVLNDMARHLRELNEERDASADARRIAGYDRKIREEGTMAAQTLIGLVLASGKTARDGLELFANIKTLFPSEFQDLLDQLFTIFDA